jgi:NAD(P)-dependent dehydrogenase (short-subunit alcohol dehydrogenase family)
MKNNKTYLIFGGIGGIGGALADQLTAQGHEVYVTTSRPARASETSLPADRVLHVDALQPETISQAIKTFSERGLDGLVYCIGSIDLKPLERTTADDMLRTFQLNTVGAFIAIKESAALLAAANGAVVLFYSNAASRGFANHTAIGTAKAAVEGLARSVAAELAPKVRVNVIAPSLTDTPLAKTLTQNPKMAETIAAMHPIPRLGLAHEMAKTAAFLLSEDAGWISGQVIAVDGGRSALEKAR